MRSLFRSDEGFTLSELAMYGLLLAIVVAVGAAFVLSGTVAERTVRTVFGASTQAQLAADSIETGVRNSSGFSVTVPFEGTQLLSARVAQGDTDDVLWTCAAWFYTPFKDDGSIWYTTNSDTGISVAPETDLSGWTLLADKVEPMTGLEVFGVASDHLSFAYKTFASDEDPPAGISSSVSSRTQIWETAPCF